MVFGHSGMLSAGSTQISECCQDLGTWQNVGLLKLHWISVLTSQSVVFMPDILKRAGDRNEHFKF